jgi:ABC-type multidrug transport system fused ATPase/permease subunit
VEAIPSQLGDTFEIINRAIGQNASNLIFSGAAGCSGVLIAFIVGPKFAAALLVTLPLIAVILIVGMGKVKVSAITKMGAIAKLGAVTEESLAAIKVIVSFNREEEALKKFTDCATEYRQKSIKADSDIGRFMGLMTSMIFGIYLIALGLGSVFIEYKVKNEVFGEDYNIGHVLIVCISLLTGLMVTMGMQPNITMKMQACTKASIIFEVLNRVPKIKD